MGWNSTSFSCFCTAYFCYSSRSKHQSYHCEHCSIDTSEQNNDRKCVQEMVPLNLGELFLYQPDNTVTDDIVHSSKWRKSGCSCVHSSWHNLCPIHCNCVLPYSNEKRVKASHATVVYETQSEQDIWQKKYWQSTRTRGSSQTTDSECYCTTWVAWTFTDRLKYLCFSFLIQTLYYIFALWCYLIISML